MTLEIIGGGPEHVELERRAGAAVAEGRIRFLGEQPSGAVHDRLATIDIAILPSHTWYSSPIKLFEYGAAGCATIAADTPPVREVMTDGRDGLLVPPGDRDALRAALLRLARDPELRLRLANSWRARVLERHTWARHAERTVEFLRRAVAEREHRASS